MKIRLQKNQKGAALITVLVIVFVVMAIIANLTIRNYRVIRRLTNQKVMEQSYAILATAIDFGRAGLATSGAASNIDTLSDLWAQPLPKTTILDNMQMSGYIIDEQGKFNLNDLVTNGAINPTVLLQLTTLFSYLNVPTTLANNIALYIAAPANEAGIMSQYTSSNPAYSPAGRPLIDLSELLLVKGMDAKWLYKLSQYVTVIPQQINYATLATESNSGESNSALLPVTVPTGTGLVNVNINTAPAEVIAAKSGIPLALAQRIVTLRTVTPFQSQQDINAFLASNGIIVAQGGTGATNITTEALVTQSSYFSIHAVVDSGDYEFEWVALVFRANRSGPWPQILWQHPE